jgi:glycosyltransferase involved in cell wall biosynthesis/polysaccharide pyruvyl transferase WcaK-like protein
MIPAYSLRVEAGVSLRIGKLVQVASLGQNVAGTNEERAELQMRNVSLFYGHVSSNIGDIAINRGTENLIRTLYPQASLNVILSGKQNDDYISMAKASFDASRGTKFTFLRRSLQNCAKYCSNPVQFIFDSCAQDDDVIIINSNEFLFSYPHQPNLSRTLWTCLPIYAAKYCKKQVLILPCTFGPFSNSSSKELISSILRLVDGYSTRDAHSQSFVIEALRLAPPPLLLDPAFFLKPPQSKNQTELRDGQVLGLAMRSESVGIRLTSYKRQTSGHSAALSFSTHLCSRFLSTAHRRVVIFAQTKADWELADAICAKLEEQGLGKQLEQCRADSIDTYLGQLSQVDYLVSSRFHALIMALLQDVPVSAVYFQPLGHKIPGLFQLLRLDSKCINLSAARTESAVTAILDDVERSSLRTHGDVATRIEWLRHKTIDWLASVQNKQVAPPVLLSASNALVSHAAKIQRERTKRSHKHRKKGSELKVGSSSLNDKRVPIRALVSFRRLAKRGLSRIITAAQSLWEQSDIELAYRDAIAAGDIAKAYEAIKQVEALQEKSPRQGSDKFLTQTRRSSIYQLKALEHVVDGRAKVKPYKKRICYIVDDSLPYSSGGSAVRGHGFACALAELGYQVASVTRPGFPLDRHPSLLAHEIPASEAIDGIKYVRLLEPLRNDHSPVDHILLSANALENALSEERPELVIATTNYRTGLPSLIACRRLGIPFIYEVRGFWELSKLSREPDFSATLSFKVQQFMEGELCKRSDKVLTLTGAMRSELTKRGVKQETIALVPNGCNPEIFVPQPRNHALADELGIPQHVPVIGYIGTFSTYEGLDDLLLACTRLKARGHEFRLLLVGSGKAGSSTNADALRAAASSAGCQEWLILPGRVPHAKIGDYYSLIDIASYPRKQCSVCEMVSPIKPLEAMALEKAVIVSSVGALEEMVQHRKTGLVYHKGNLNDLVEMLELALINPNLRIALGKQARRWVQSERTWKKCAETASMAIGEVLSGRWPQHTETRDHNQLRY